MKKDNKIIIIAVLAVALGLAIGYFAFGGEKQRSSVTEVHQHNGSEGEKAEEIWTCSMHPQIRQNEPGQCPICGMDLIPASSAGGSSDPLVLEMTEDAVKLANIQTTIVGEQTGGNTSKSIALSGKVQADERLAASLVAHVPGRIEKLYVTFTGEQVNKGQKLASIYSPELVTAQRELLEALRLKDINPELAEAARNKLRYWKISDRTLQKIEQEGKVKETFTLYADESGVVTGRRVAVGDYVKKGEALFDIMNLRRVWVLFDAYEEDLPSISLGAKIEFTTPSIPNKVFNTRITFIDPVINPKTRTVAVRTEVNNRTGLLKPEMFVNGTLQNKVGKSTALTVPKTAVLWTGKRSVVYVKVPDMAIPSFQFREIELGESLGDSYQVVNGLKPGEEVVTYGNFTIDAAAQLNNQTSMMNRNVSVEGMEQMEHLPDYTASTPLDFKQQLLRVVNVYLELKDAFVSTDSEKVNNDAKRISEALSDTDMSLLKGDAHLYWMEQLNAMKARTKKMIELQDIEELRTQFAFFSEALIYAVKAFGIPEGKLYVEHCPMAMDNEGADWISKEKKIRNPYFGEKMMTCGTVEDTIFQQ